MDKRIEVRIDRGIEAAACIGSSHLLEDLERLAAHFAMTRKEAKKRFTRKDKSEEKKNKAPRILRHKEDEIFGTICTFFDQDSRGCGIYEARPQTCRDYPGRKRCGYYEFLSFERDAQQDPDYIAVTGN